MTEEQMKAEFEAFLAMQMPTFSPELLFERRKDGEYVSLVAHYSWKAWQAAIASQDKNMPSLEDCHYEYPVVDESEESDAGVWPVLVPNGFKIVKDNQPTDDRVRELNDELLAFGAQCFITGIDTHIKSLTHHVAQPNETTIKSIWEAMKGANQ